MDMVRNAVFFAAAMAIAGCSGQSQSSSTPAPTIQPMTAATAMAPPMHGQSLIVTIRAQNGSGETGTATLLQMGTHTRVTLAIDGEPVAGDQPAHVHPGTCAKLNPVPNYPLHDVVQGKSTTVISATLAQLEAKPMAINVHESVKQIAKYVACGDIRK
jgi:hypothetical protein